MTFVDVAALNKNMTIDTRYATEANFLKEPHWGYELNRHLCLVHKNLASALKDMAGTLFNGSGLNLLIFTSTFTIPCSTFDIPYLTKNYNYC